MSSFATGKTVGSVHRNFSSGNEHRSPGYYNDPRNIGRGVEDAFTKFGRDMPQTMRENIDAARSGETPDIPLFLPLQVPSQSRDDLRGLPLALSPRAVALGIRMTPETVLSTLPIKLKDLPRVEWVPDSEDLVLAGSPREGIWRPSAWTPTPWVAELGDADLLPGSFDETWVRDHVMLFLNMGEIPPNAANGFRLPLSWALTGIEDPDEVHRLLGALRVGPRQNEDRLVPMDRVVPEDG